MRWQFYVTEGRSKVTLFECRNYFTEVLTYTFLSTHWWLSIATIHIDAMTNWYCEYICTEHRDRMSNA